MVNGANGMAWYFWEYCINLQKVNSITFISISLYRIISLFGEKKTFWVYFAVLKHPTVCDVWLLFNEITQTVVQ